MKSIIFFASLFFISCGNDDITIEDLEAYGYKKTYCGKVDYIDLKNDENPYYYTYRKVEKIKNNLEIILARCIEEEAYCSFETVEGNKVICQKLIVVNNKDELVSEFDNNSTLLTFNAQDLK